MIAGEPSAEKIAGGPPITLRMHFAGADGPPLPATFEEGPGDYGFIHRQTTPADTWVITHGFHRYPQVTVQDTGEQEQLAEVTHISTDELSIRFSEPCQGTAWLL